MTTEQIYTTLQGLAEGIYGPLHVIPDPDNDSVRIYATGGHCFDLSERYDEEEETTHYVLTTDANEGFNPISKAYAKALIVAQLEKAFLINNPEL